MEFKAWPKIPRLVNEQYYITEKIDGTNACVIIQKDCGHHTGGRVETNIGAQSRSRIIVPGDDNFGFAQWVQENREDLLKLGEGYHYGEWWGQGIQRGYGLDHKRFSLFAWWTPEENMPDCCHRIPLLTSDPVEGTEVQSVIDKLKSEGSVAAPGFMQIEGVVVTSRYYKASYKIIVDK